MPNFGHLLPPPLSVRRGVLFYYAKGEDEFRQDVYERYDELVTRQTALHLADALHGGYPLQPLLDYVLRQLPAGAGLAFADVGCSVGRLAAELATRHPDWDGYALDLSYQMLRQGRDYWTLGKEIRPNLLRYGWGTPRLSGQRLPNLHFALARGERLPFADATLDVLINTFLLDRLPNPLTVFAEWGRVLRPGGTLVVVTPLNFLDPAGWRAAHPPVKVLSHVRQQGWELVDWTDPLPLREPMDARGNAVHWSTVALTLRRPL